MIYWCPVWIFDIVWSPCYHDIRGGRSGAPAPWLQTEQWTQVESQKVNCSGEYKRTEYYETKLIINMSVFVSDSLGPDSVSRCCPTTIGNLIMEMRWFLTVGFPILTQRHLYIESGPWMLPDSVWSWPSSGLLWCVYMELGVCFNIKIVVPSKGIPIIMIRP